MITYLSSGLAELLGLLLLPLLTAFLGSAISAAVTTVVTTLLALSIVHGLGLSVAFGSHRLRHRGHWLTRPLGFSAAFVVLAFGSLASNAVLIGGVLTRHAVSWWVALAPISALIVQIASGVILALWGLDRLVRILGDYLGQVGIGTGERQGVWWQRIKVGSRWIAAAIWALAALGLAGGSLMGAVLTVPLFTLADADTIVALTAHGALMLLGVAAGVVLLVSRVASLRKSKESSRTWSARIRGRSRERLLGKIWRVCLSLTGWLAGELSLWLSCAGAVLFVLLCAVTLLDSEIRLVALAAAAACLPFVVGGLWLARTGGVLRALRLEGYQAASSITSSGSSSSR